LTEQTLSGLVQQHIHQQFHKFTCQRM